MVAGVTIFFYIKGVFPYNYISHFRIYCCDYCLLLNLLLCQHLISFWASLPAPKLWVVSGARCHVLAKRKQMTQKFKKWNKWHKTLNWKLGNISGCYISKKETNETELLIVNWEIYWRGIKKVEHTQTETIMFLFSKLIVYFTVFHQMMMNMEAPILPRDPDIGWL